MFRLIPKARLSLNATRKLAQCSLPHARSYAVAAPAVGNYTPSEDGPTLNSPSELARRISAKVLPRLEKPDVKKVLVVGSGGLSIGQAGEFDYSGERYFWPVLTNRFSSYQGSSREQHFYHPYQSQHCHHPNFPPPRQRNLLPPRHCRLRRVRTGEGAPGWYPPHLRWSVRIERRYSARQDGCPRATRCQGARYTHQNARGI